MDVMWRVWRGAGRGDYGWRRSGWAGEDGVVVQRRDTLCPGCQKRVIRRLGVAVVVVLALSFVCLEQL